MELILHNIRSVYNVGAIFRTADAVGVEKIYLTGYSPTPLDRFGKIRKDFHKSALGAENSVSWEQNKNIATLISRLKKDNYELIGLEQDNNSIDYKKCKPKRKSVLIVGNEVRGISKPLRQKCDKLIEIPMSGKKESLNVSVATGIVLYRMLDI